jgi:hypothetical protein
VVKKLAVLVEIKTLNNSSVMAASNMQNLFRVGHGQKIEFSILLT